MTFAQQLAKFRAESAAFQVHDDGYESWLDSLPVMSAAEHDAYAREYAEAECATGRFEQQFPHLAD